jgi:hypothetical protein
MSGSRAGTAVVGLDRPGPTGVLSTTRELGVQACVPLLVSIHLSDGQGKHFSSIPLTGAPVHVVGFANTLVRRTAA